MACACSTLDNKHNRVMKRGGFRAAGENFDGDQALGNCGFRGLFLCAEGCGEIFGIDFRNSGKISGGGAFSCVRRDLRVLKTVNNSNIENSLHKE